MAHARQLARDGSNDSRAALARALLAEATPWAEQLNYDRSLELTQEAVALYRELAAAQPEAFEPDLASSLNSLGSDLYALAR